MNEAHHLAARLHELASTRPSALALVTVDAQGDTRYDYAELDRRATRIARYFAEHRASGERALLLLDSGVDYVSAFFGCLRAGVVAVPVYPPESKREQHLARLRAIAADAGVRYVLTSSASRERFADEYASLAPGAQVVAVDTLCAAVRPEVDDDDPCDVHDVHADDIAFLQYTSGSTGTPKGVMVSHGNLIANEIAIRSGLGVTDADVFVSWLPLYHDMGLIGSLLQPVFSGIPLVLMSPQFFLERPVRWLEAIARHRGTISGAPDFAYRLCVERVRGDACAALDLSSWRLAFSGSEPVRRATLDAFVERFAGSGFDADALYPCYGLAEATLFVTGGARGVGMVSGAFDSEALRAGRVAIARDDESASVLVGCGRPQAGHALAIVDPQSGARLPDDRIGEIHVSGPSIAHGYWQRAEASAQTFAEAGTLRWLRTGDLGFVHDGELYIAGRCKDLIIVRGRNLYPQDIEQVVEAQCEFARKGRVIAFAAERDGIEGAALALEVAPMMKKRFDAQEMIERLNRAVFDACGETPVVVVLLNPAALPKTSSGKLQRSATRDGWRAASLDTWAVWEAGGFVSGADAKRASGETLDPRDGIERELAMLWSEAIGMEAARLSRASHFFTQGGSSLTAGRLAVLIAARWQRRFDIGDVFEVPVLAEMAARIAARLDREIAQFSCAAIATSAKPALSHAQQRQLFAAQLDPESRAYHVAAGIRLHGRLDVDTLEASLETIVARHAALRTVFVESTPATTDGVAPGPEPVILPAARVPCRTVDLREWVNEAGPDGDARIAAFEDDAARERSLSALAREFAAEAFDLAHGPLLRAACVKLRDDEHVLLLAIHHIATDAWSMQILVDELVTEYRSRTEHTQAVIATPAIGYNDYAAWQNQWLATPDAQTQIDYWRATLGTHAPESALPFDHAPLGELSASPAARVAFNLPAALAQDVSETARSCGTTPFVVLLAAYHAWLYRATGHADVRTGVPVANRQLPQTHGVVGFFTNTIVLRSDCRPDMTLDALICALRDAATAGQTHQALPIDVLVEQLNPSRDGERSPLFDTTFNYLIDDYPALERWPDAIATRYDVPELHTKVPLALDLRETRDGGLHGYVTYAANRFERGTIERMVAQFQQVTLAFAGSRNACTLASLDLLDAHTRTRVDTASVGPLRERPFEPLHVRVARYAQSQPDAIALVDGALSLGYRELDEQAGQVARWLLARGLRVGDRVALVASRSADFVVAMLGVFKAGGTYVPLDAASPRQRVDDMLRDCGARYALLETEGLAGPVEGVIPGTIGAAVRGLETASRAQPVALPHVPSLEAAYVIYTSGSSGTPKGVVVSHGALANYVDALIERVELPPGLRYAMVSTIAADLGHTVLFGALATGGALHLIDRDTTLDADAFAHYMAAQRIDVLKIVPGHLQALLQAERAADALPAHTLVVGGEATSWTTLDAIRALKPALRVVNHYGPTETTVGILTQDAAHADRHAATLPVGRPLPNACARVLDAHMNPVGEGEVGELYLGGAGLARGYLDRPALTAERFVPDPFIAGGRLYRSGDRARWLADGAIEYLGRADDQVKVRGYRVEPGEIAARLRSLDGVRDAAVVVAGSGRLAGFAVARLGHELDPVALRRALGGVLPDYMVPSIVRVVDGLPLNRNGKLDRQTLVAMAAARAPNASRDDGPGATDADPRVITATEQALAHIWAAVLGLDVQRVTPSENFFTLGGHSLAAMKMLSRIRSTWPIELPLRAIFDVPTLGALAQRIDALCADTAPIRDMQSPPRLQRDASKLPLLSLAQQRIWVVDQLAGGGLASYNMAAALTLRGALEPSTLKMSIADVVARHDVLRSSIGSDDGEPLLSIAPALDVPMPVIDANMGHEASGRDAYIEALLEASARTPFDLAVAPLLRTSLVRFDGDHHVLLVALHHIVADGASVQVLIDELCAAYAARQAGAKPAFAPLPAQYADYAAWQRDQLRAARLADEQRFWRAALADAPHHVALPLDRARPAVASHRGGALQFMLPMATADRIAALATAHRMTPFAVLLASFQVFLHGLTGQRDLLIGTDVAGRERAEFERLIGFFVNVLPVRSCIASDRANLASFHAWIDAMKPPLFDALEHRALPFDRIVDALGVIRRRDANPLLQLLFVLRDLPRGNASIPGLNVELVRPRTVQSKFDMALFVEPRDGGYEIEWVYASALFDATTIERWRTQWLAVLDQVLTHPDQALEPILEHAGTQAAANHALAAASGHVPRDEKAALPS